MESTSFSFLDLVIPALRVTKKFPRDVGAEQIKDWARQEADSLQHWFDWLAMDVCMHNDGLEERIADGLARRRAELHGLDNLKGGLSGGI